jgi:ankyrin repeat protein
MAGDGRDGPKDDTEAEGELEVYWEAVREGDKLAIEAMLVGDEEHPPIGIGVDVTDREGLTTLMWLTVEGHATVAQWLIDDVDADVEMTDKRYGQTALHFAAVKGNNMIAELLLHRKCDPARRDFAGWTPLHAAARAGSLDVATVLLGVLTKDQVNATAAGGQTPLHRAAFWGHAELAQLLLQHGADPDLVDSKGRRACDLACDGGERRAELPALLKLLMTNPALPRAAAA